MSAEWHPKQDLESIGAARREPPKRATRVADAIRTELSILLVQHARDPHLRDVTITRVVVSDDLRHAKIYYTHLRGKQAVGSAQQGLNRATGFMRSHLAKTLNLRFTPELRFWYDEDADKAMEMEKLLAEIARERDEREQGPK